MSQVNMKAVITADDRASGVISGVGASFTKLAGAMGVGQLAANAVSRAFDALTGAAKGAVTSAASFEQTRIGLENMLGSADKARVLLSQISKFAAETPFEFPELAQATKQLVAFGFSGEEAFDTMKQLGDVSAAIGAPINEIAYLMGTLRTQGRAFTIDIRQFAQRGIPIYEYLAKVLKVNTNELSKLIEEGKVGFPEVQKAFQMMTAEGGKFHGTMAKQSKSLTGLFSTLKDTLGQVGRSLLGISEQGDVVSGGIFDRMRVAVSSLISALGNNLPTIQAFFTTLVSTITNLVTKIIELGRAIGDYLAPKFQALGNTILALSPQLNYLYQAIILPLGRALGIGLVGAIGLLIDSINFLMRVWALFTPMIQFTVNAITGILLPALRNLWASLGPEGQTAVKVIAGLIGGALVATFVSLAFTIGVAIAIIGSLIALLAALVGKVRETIGAIVDFGQAAQRWVVGALQQVGEWVMQTMHRIANLRAGLNGAMAGVYDVIVQPFVSAFNAVMRGAEAVQKKISELSNTASNVAKSVLDPAGLVLKRNAAGTDFFTGGATMVGEQGPEKVILPRGSKVIPNNSLNQAGGGGGATINITVQAGAFMGAQQDARQYAVVIANALKDYAEMNGTTVASILGG